MSIDVTDLRAFYASPLGAVVCRLVGRRIDRFWDNLRGLRVAGLGFAVPYLGPLRERCERTLAFMPAQQGVVNWPASGLSASALCDPLYLPLDDASVDRILVVHALEITESPGDLLHEASRVLTPGGRLILVVPNRRGVWARADGTPFGQGQPFSRSQLRDLMRRAQVSPDGWAETLFIPPLRSRFLLGGAAAWEAMGTALALPFAGLHVVEATKQIHRPILVGRRSGAVRLAPMLKPVPASRDRHGS